MTLSPYIFYYKMVDMLDLVSPKAKLNLQGLFGIKLLKFGRNR